MKTDLKVVGVISSPRNNGNTAALVREALKGVSQEGAQVTEVFLFDYRMEFCRGCLSCMQTGRCHLADDFTTIRDLLYGADGIIWGSPTYGGAPNAMMKCLIDRLGMFEVSTSSLGGKYMAGISAANSAMAAVKVAKKLAQFGNGGTFMRSYTSGWLGRGFSGGKNALEDKEGLGKAKELGMNVIRDIRSSRRYIFQNLPGRLLSSLVMKPAFRKYITKNKDGDAKFLYSNLRQRGLLS